MKLTLAVVLECSPTECKVQPLEEDMPITVHYSAPVKSNIVIRPDQLVALDTTPDVPEIVYRWHNLQVKQSEGDKVLLDDHRGHLVEAVNAEGLDVAPQVDDWVFAALGEKGEIIDISIDGRPAHPAFLREHVLPKVEEFYQKRASNS
jgi:hypothetical protein